MGMGHADWGAWLSAWAGGKGGWIRLYYRFLRGHEGGVAHCLILWKSKDSKGSAKKRSGYGNKFWEALMSSVCGCELSTENRSS